MAVPILIPSLGRHDRVRTTKAIANVTAIVVPASQGDLYREHNPDVEIVEHPDDVMGLAAKLQWMLTHWGGEMFSIDDDIKGMARAYIAPGEGTPIKMSPEEAYERVQLTAEMARELGAYLFGFTATPDPKHYEEHRPFRMSGYVIGGFMGILKGSKLWYPTDDRRCDLNADYWISLLNAYYHRYCFVDGRFSFTDEKSFKNTGGCATFRTVDQERESYMWLLKMFGSKLIRLKGKNALRRRSHEWEHSLEMPF